MDANVVFRAYACARDEMERDLAKRAEYGFMIPVTPTRAHFGIAIEPDKYAKQWQRHHRQMEAFENRMRHIVNMIDNITYPENIGKAKTKGR